MEKASRAIRRSGAKLLSIGSSGNSDLPVMISELKDMRNNAKGFMNAQNSASQDLIRWAANEENRAVQDVANHIAQLNLQWTEVQKDFIESLKEYRQMFELVLEGEKHVMQAKNDLSQCEQKESKLKKDLRKAEKKNMQKLSALFCGSGRRAVEEEIHYVDGKLTQAENARRLAEIEVTDRVRENEAIKMIRLKEGFIRMADAYIDLGKKCATIFEAQKNVAMEIPDVHGKDLEEVKYSGAGNTQMYVQEAKEKMQKLKRKSYRLNPPMPHPRYTCTDPGTDPPPPYYSDENEPAFQKSPNSSVMQVGLQKSPNSGVMHGGLQKSPSFGVMQGGTQRSPSFGVMPGDTVSPPYNRMYPDISKEHLQLDKALTSVKIK